MAMMEIITNNNWQESRGSQADSIGRNLYLKGESGHYFHYNNGNLPVILTEVDGFAFPFFLTMTYRV